MPEKLVMDKKECSRALGVSLATLERLRVRGAAPPEIRIGTRVLFPVEKLRQFVNGEVR